MRRAVLTLGSTAAGLAVLLSFKTHSAAPDASAATAPSASPTAGGAVAAAGAALGTGAGQPAGATSPSPSRSRRPRHTGTSTRVVTGATENTQYGPMQVQLTLIGTRITKATVLKRTDDGAESDQIDAAAIPKLTSETIAAQSARIDAVSGASYTSSGYIKSLQSAIDKARA